MALTLFHYWRSSSSWRLRWALELKKIPHEKVAVNLLAGEEKLPGYTGKNKAAYVPCLVADGKVMAESMAIIEWLDETYPGGVSFLPGDAAQRALMRRLAETINSGIQPLHNLDVLKKISADKETQNEWVRFWVGKGLAVFESILAESCPMAKKFSLSDEPSLADLFLIPQVYVAYRFELEMAPFPRCEAIYRHALSTPACIASHPDSYKPAGTA